MSFRRARSVLKAELASIRRSDPDLDAGDITLFTLPLVVRAAALAAIGVVPLLVVRATAPSRTHSWYRSSGRPRW